MPEHRGVLVSADPLRRRHIARRVAAVAIRDEKAAETLSMERVEDVAQDRDVGLSRRDGLPGYAAKPIVSP